MIKIITFVPFGLLLVLLTGCQGEPSSLNSAKAVPTKSTFDWIICGRTSMDDVRARLGEPFWSSDFPPVVDEQTVQWVYQWKCEPFPFVRHKDLDWEWGPSNAARIRAEQNAPLKEGAEVEVSLLTMEDIVWEPLREEGDLMPAVELWVIFNKGTGRVWHKAFFGPPD